MTHHLVMYNPNFNASFLITTVLHVGKFTMHRSPSLDKYTLKCNRNLLFEDSQEILALIIVISLLSFHTPPSVYKICSYYYCCLVTLLYYYIMFKITPPLDHDGYMRLNNMFHNQCSITSKFTRPSSC